MKRDMVSSSNVASIGYDENTKTLEVEFLSGAVYHYYGVNLSVYEMFMNAPSKGRFLNASIKNIYSYSRIG